MKMVKITGELAKAAGIPEDAEPMPLEYILEAAAALAPTYPRTPSPFGGLLIHDEFTEFGREKLAAVQDLEDEYRRRNPGGQK